MVLFVYRTPDHAIFGELSPKKRPASVLAFFIPRLLKTETGLCRRHIMSKVINDSVKDSG